jgi:hypothetical protein
MATVAKKPLSKRAKSSKNIKDPGFYHWEALACNFFTPALYVEPRTGNTKPRARSSGPHWACSYKALDVDRVDTCSEFSAIVMGCIEAGKDLAIKYSLTMAHPNPTPLSSYSATLNSGLSEKTNMEIKTSYTDVMDGCVLLDGLGKHIF